MVSSVKVTTASELTHDAFDVAEMRKPEARVVPSLLERLRRTVRGYMSGERGQWMIIKDQALGERSRTYASGGLVSAGMVTMKG